MLPARRTVHGGFTLLELLVVVAVIGLLLALLLPALSAASEAGRAAVCGMNLNQLGYGSIAYSHQQNDRLPYYGPKGIITVRPANLEWWPTQVARGMENFEPGIYRCPSDPYPRRLGLFLYQGTAYMADRPRGRPDARHHLTLDLTYRGPCELVDFRPNPPVARKVTDWNRPYDVIQLIEASGMRNRFKRVNLYKTIDCFRIPNLILMGPSVSKRNSTWVRHLGVTNVLFIDGHVETEAPEKIAAKARASMRAEVFHR